MGLNAAAAFGTSLLGSAKTKARADAAQHTINRGNARIARAEERLASGSRYWKGGYKRGKEILVDGIYQRNKARGTASVIGSLANGVYSLGKFCLS